MTDINYYEMAIFASYAREPRAERPSDPCEKCQAAFDDLVFMGALVKGKDGLYRDRPASNTAPGGHDW